MCAGNDNRAVYYLPSRTSAFKCATSVKPALNDDRDALARMLQVSLGRDREQRLEGQLVLILILKLRMRLVSRSRAASPPRQRRS